MIKPKKMPERMCSGCKERKPKKDLIRVVRNPEGAILLDRTGKLSGRGAYLCPKAECLRLAKKAKRLERSLETAIPDTVYTELEETLTLEEDT